MKVAIVGTGISGLTAALCLDKQYDITLFEKEYRVGGHTNTFLNWPQTAEHEKEAIMKSQL